MVTRLVRVGYFVGSVATAALAPGLAQAETYTIGTLEDMTGAYSFAGATLIKGERLAVEQMNAKGALGAGNTLALVTEDAASDRTQAATLLSKFGADSKILAVLGPTSTIEVLADGPIAIQAKLPMITVSPLQQSLDIGPYVFQTTISSRDYMGQLTNYFIDKTHATNCSFVTVTNNVAFIAQYEAVRDTLKQRGGKIVSDDVVQASDTDFSALATKIVNLHPDCLALNVPVDQSANFIVQIKQLGLPDSVHIIGNNASASKAFLNAGKKAVEGVYVISEFAPPGLTAAQHTFNDDFFKRFGDIPDNWAAVGYTKVQMLVDAIKRSQPNPTRETVRDALNSIKDLPVIVGKGDLSVDSGRHTHYQMSILVVKDGKFVEP
jgi:branched-chain amino acid transport system substrate-binding protein